ncbi:hypothetical protein [Paenibacillus sp. BAC0078]
MSEAGKVSLPMTPERKEEIKRDYENTKSAIRNHIVPGHIKRIVVNTGELLAALEEAEQQLKEMTNNAVGWKEQYIAEWAKRSMLERELAEAQQTIARKRTVIREAMIELNGALNFTVAAPNDDTRILKRIIDRAFIALNNGLEEGETQP